MKVVAEVFSIRTGWIVGVIEDHVARQMTPAEVCDHVARYRQLKLYAERVRAFLDASQRVEEAEARVERAWKKANVHSAERRAPAGVDEMSVRIDRGDYDDPDEPEVPAEAGP